jgi:hypothetical protein
MHLVKHEASPSGLGPTKYLTNKENEVYGDRIPPGYTKTNLMFKDETQVIWLAQKGKDTFTIKQVPKTLVIDESLIENE